MRIHPRVFAVGFLQNLASFMAWSVIPVWAKYEAKASPLQLGLLPVLSGLTYIVVARRAGALSDRVPRGAMARFGLALFALFCGLAWLTRSVWAISALGVLNGFGMALIWPAIQAKIGDDSSAGDLERNLGDFSISWSAGKTSGFLAFPLVYGVLGMGFHTLLVCGGLGLLILPLLPSGGPSRRDGEAPLVSDDHHPAALRAGHLRAGWWANFASYGMGAILVYLYPDLLVGAGRPASHQGWVLGTLYGVQTAGFWWFGRHAGWRYRLGPLHGWMAAGAAALLVLGFGAPLAAAVPAAAVLGLALGQAYAASVYYSVHSEEERGARAGIHEAVIGAADFGLPLLGGLLAQASGWTPAPYALGALAAGTAMVMGARAVRAHASAGRDGAAPPTSATA